MSLCDKLTLEQRERGFWLNETAGIPAEENIITRADRLLRREFPNLGGVAVTLEKNIPTQAGLGGGSTDAAAYLRGAFLGSGFISNPKSDFHFEITVESEALAEGLVELMARKDITARIMARRSSYMVYLKSGNAITEFLAFTGAHQAALSMEEERVVKSVRNDVNRQINAELANQQKAASAAVEQIYAIRRAVEHYGMEDLPPAIREFIRLRVTYPEASLKELGQRATPPLSKSAVYHRVRRLE